MLGGRGVQSHYCNIGPQGESHGMWRPGPQATWAVRQMGSPWCPQISQTRRLTQISSPRTAFLQSRRSRVTSSPPLGDWRICWDVFQGCLRPPPPARGSCLPGACGGGERCLQARTSPPQVFGGFRTHRDQGTNSLVEQRPLCLK